jgi:AcrR family transcriptional regulator
MAIETGGRSEQRRAVILEAATEVFLRNGYLGTTMDEIAALAAASKQTVYKHFSGKEFLFSEIVMHTVAEIANTNDEEIRALAHSDDLDTDLRVFARRQLDRVVQPRLLQLRRLVIGESGRFPELGQLFYDQGAGRTIAALAISFERLADRGLLEVEDPDIAAAHFNWLVMSAPINRAMMLGDDHPATPEELDHYADAGVGAFLAAYGGAP